MYSIKQCVAVGKVSPNQAGFLLHKEGEEPIRNMEYDDSVYTDLFITGVQFIRLQKICLFRK